MTVAERVAMTAIDADAGGALAAALRPLLEPAASRREPTLVAAAVPIPALDPVALFVAARAQGDEPSLWLQPSHASAFLGLGRAWSVESADASRFGDVSRGWSAVLDGALVEPPEPPPGVGPVLLGGFGFDPDGSMDPMWEGFASASFVLPELLLTSSAERSWLTASLVVDGDASVAAALDSIVERWERIARAAPPTTDVPRGTLRVTASRPEASAWRDSVARLAGAVGRGRLDKAVLARQVRLAASSDIDLAAVLRRLARSAPESTLFALSRGARTFIGATPEPLVSLRGRDFRTVAMAGSARRADDPEADAMLAAELLASDKEREEHAVVVTMLRETLAPLAERLDIPERPSVVRLRHVQHLVTPVSGRLRDALGVLALVERLHPTPAVGGSPRDLALELIAEEEASRQRGWYAGPLGWLDRDGDGEFVVALRSGLVEGREATLFAGCGIVADSDPDREWDESSTKLLALGSALGRIEP